MTSEVDETEAEIATTDGYQLACTDCAFETTVDGSSLDALDVATTHQEEHGDDATDHFVKFEHRSSSSEGAQRR